MTIENTFLDLGELMRLRQALDKAEYELAETLKREMDRMTTTTPVDPQNSVNLRSHALDHTLANSWHAEHERRIDVEFENARLRAELAGVHGEAGRLIQYLKRGKMLAESYYNNRDIHMLAGTFAGTVEEAVRQLELIRISAFSTATTKQPCEGCINGS